MSPYGLLPQIASFQSVGIVFIVSTLKNKKVESGMPIFKKPYSKIVIFLSVTPFTNMF